MSNFYKASGDDARSAKVEKTSITTSIHEFDKALERLAEYTQHLRMLNDRVIGAGSREVAKQPKLMTTTPEQSLLGAINSRRTYLVETLSDLESVVTELEQNI